MCAATPPLEAIRLLLSDLATRHRAGAGGAGRRGQRKAMCIDVRKAHLRAMAGENKYVALPPEVAERGMRAQLVGSMYGMRDVPSIWGYTRRRRIRWCQCTCS